MAQEDINKVVGDSFEDLKEDEMVQTQGAGDVDPETTPATPAIVVASEAIITAGATAAASVLSAKTVKGKC